jgi:hypothetical protein
MTDYDHVLKTGETSYYEAQLTWTGSPSDLQGGATAKLKMAHVQHDHVTAEFTMSIEDAAQNIVSYTFGLSDLTIAGPYRAEVEVTFPDTSEMAFPREGYQYFLVEEALS